MVNKGILVTKMHCTLKKSISEHGTQVGALVIGNLGNYKQHDFRTNALYIIKGSTWTRNMQFFSFPPFQIEILQMFWSNRRDRFAFSDGTKSFGVALRNLGVAPKVGVAGVAPEVGEKAPLCTPLCTPLLSNHDIYAFLSVILSSRKPGQKITPPSCADHIWPPCMTTIDILKA